MRKKTDELINYIRATRLESGKPICPREKVMVGVLTTPRKGGAYPLPVGKDSRLKREMTETARTHGIFMFFFYAEGFEMNTDTVTGHCFVSRKGKSGRWITAVFSRPQIVYNRLSYRKDEAQKEVKQLLAYLQTHPGIKLFNPRFLDKWEVYKSLAGNNRTREMTPETHLFNRNHLGLMLQMYPELFIKPIDKSVGKGIIIVRRRPDERGYEYKSACSNRDWQRCRLAQDLYANLKRGMDPGRKYLIQRGLQLVQMDGRVFDLRVQVQKDGKGEWVMTGIGVRVAAPNKHVTHVPNGGSRADYYAVMKRICGGSSQRLRMVEEQLRHICETVPGVLEKSLDMNLGILSMDIGLEQTGVLQIIEVNSKPASFDEDQIRRRHLEYLNQYFFYLSQL